MKKYFLIISLCLLTQWLFAQNQTKIDSLKQVLEKANDDTSKINLMNSLCGEFMQIGDLEQARKYAEDALSGSKTIMIGKTRGWLKGESNALNNIGNTYENEGNYDKA